MILEDDEIAVAIPAKLSQKSIETTNKKSEKISPDSQPPKPKRFGAIDLWHIRNQRRFGNFYRNRY